MSFYNTDKILMFIFLLYYLLFKIKYVFSRYKFRF